MPSNNGHNQLLNSFSSTHHHNPIGSHQSPSSSLQPRFVNEIFNDETQASLLKIGDKIVWLSDNGPEPGVVKWLGKLPDIGNEWMAGVDFVNPIGSGTGSYNDQALFHTKPNHASLVPVVGLIRATDFQCNVNNVKQPFDDCILQPPVKPKRTKKLTETSKFYTTGTSNESKNSSETLIKTSDPDRKNDYHSTMAKFANITTSLADFKLTNNNCKNNNHSNMVNDDSCFNDNDDDTQALIKLTSNKSNSPSKPNEFNSKSRSSFDDSRPLEQIKQQTKINGSSSSENDSLTDNDDDDDDELFEIGSVVEVSINSTPYHGVIRWLGFLKNDFEYKIDCIRKSEKTFRNVVAGIELDEEIAGLTDGTFGGRRYFQCSMNKAYFVSLNECLKDSRFCSSNNNIRNGTSLDDKQNSSLNFGSIDCPTVLGYVAPLDSNDLTRLCGNNRGIQGHNNSCYLDATLFAMFSFSSIFESLLNRPKRMNDIPEYNEVQRILKEEIVNPLRANLYVRADRVMHLRQILEKIGSMRGLTSEEKDPEEFINLLLNEILKTDPFLKLSSGLESLFYQLFVEKDENLQMPTVQQLFDQSFLASDIKLREVPSCLMIQMPRFGRDFKMYSKIVPSLYLDITNVLDNSPRQCIVCGLLAEYECKECFGELCEGLDSIAFCWKCLDKNHGHKKRSKHKATKLKIPAEFAMLQDHTNIPRVVMELFAVLCIETSHYVSFVKCGAEFDSPWCFFDSMADRKGEQNGYNIPKVVDFPDLKWWLSTDGLNHLLLNKDEKSIPELPKRLFSDAYICFYSSEVLRYR